MLRLLSLSACAMMAIAFATTKKAGGTVDVGSETVTKCPCTADPNRPEWIASKSRMEKATMSLVTTEANLMTDYHECFAGLFELPGNCPADDIAERAPYADVCGNEFIEWAQYICGVPPNDNFPRMDGGFFNNLAESTSRDYRKVPFGGDWDWMTKGTVCSAPNPLLAGWNGEPKSEFASFTLCGGIEVDEDYTGWQPEEGCTTSVKACDEIAKGVKQAYPNKVPGGACRDFVLQSGWKERHHRSRCNKLWYEADAANNCGDEIVQIGFCGWNENVGGLKHDGLPFCDVAGPEQGTNRIPALVHKPSCPALP